MVKIEPFSARYCSRYFHWRLGLTLLLFMVIALIPFYIAYSSISNIRIGMWLLRMQISLFLPARLFLFSAFTLDQNFDGSNMVHIFVRFLENWRWISAVECVAGSFYDSTS